MISASTTTVSVCVTPNHNLFINGVLCKAEDCFDQTVSFLRGDTPTNNDEFQGKTDEALRQYAFATASAAAATTFEPFVWQLSARQSKILLDAIMDGNKMVFSKNLDLQRLALHAGVAAFNNQEGATGIISSVVHDVTFEKTKYSGKVWCCECNGVVYVRRHGKPLWCGNSRHGQKGVIGSMIPSTMMPFTKDGLVPDIIINPHAIPTRMTIGHMIECIMAKAGAVAGFYADGTSFENQDVDKTACATLEKHGYERHGDELMYNGVTGEQMDCKIFIGPTYYFRLKHMVADKINFRSTGPVVGMTQQPTKGRSGNGGLRIGEMETNVLIAHGISSFAKESMMERSDGCLVKADETHHVNIPYAFKVFAQEMMTMSVLPLMQFESNEEKEDVIVDESEEDEDIFQN